MGLLNLISSERMKLGLDGLHEQACRMAAKCFPRDDTVPMALLIAAPRQVFIMHVDAPEGSEDRAVAMMRKAMKTVGATAYSVVSEARIAVVENVPLKDGRPDISAIPSMRDLPHDDILLVQSEDRERHRTTRWLVSGIGTNKRFLGPRIDETPGRQGGGRLQGLLS